MKTFLITYLILIQTYYVNEIITYSNVFNSITRILSDSKNKKTSNNMFKTTLKQNW